MATQLAQRDMADHAEDAAQMLRALAHGARLMVLCQLAGGEKSAGELQADSELSQSAFSQHLARLRADGLVGTRRDGTTIYYRIADSNVLTLIKALESIYCPPGRRQRAAR